MLTKSEAVTILRKVSRAFSEAFPGKLAEAYLYGSYARGDYGADSDVDILLTADIQPEEAMQYQKRLSAINSDLSLEHDVTVSATVQPLSQFKKYANVLPYYQNVLREGIRYA
ncbi:MAG: nucleotidyltransferase domain-containing protein [bacterium]